MDKIKAGWIYPPWHFGLLDDQEPFPKQVWYKGPDNLNIIFIIVAVFSAIDIITVIVIFIVVFFIIVSVIFYRLMRIIYCLSSIVYH